MAAPVTGIQPKILRWARERAGLTLDDVAHSFEKQPEEIKEWESGRAAPTYVQLERMAYSLYKRPMALFFMQEPPAEPEPEKFFRTLPDFELRNLSTDTRYAIRYAHAQQISLKELTDGRNPTEKAVFHELTVNPGSSAARSAREARDYFNVSVEQQSKLGTTDDALRFWRGLVQSFGVWVFKRAFKQKDISGFCLIDPAFPIVVLNNSNSKSRQIFSLFHELAHVLMQVNCISKTDDSYIEFLPRDEKKIERWCNEFAASFLVPAEDFDKRSSGNDTGDESIAKLARFYKVSRAVILGRFLTKKLVDISEYKRRVAAWDKEYTERREEASPGGDYYATQAVYLGRPYIGLVLGSYYKGKISLADAADYLGVRASTFGGIEQAYQATRGAA